MTNLTIAGSKGGEDKPRPSVESPDSLQSIAYARILDLVSEGEIRGLANGMKSVFLSETPLANADGSLNFSGVTLDVRTGSQDQLHIPGFPAVENEIGVGVELRADQPYVRAVTNLQLSAIRVRLSVARLAQTNTSNGDTNGYSVQYRIELATDGGPYLQVLASAFSGKTTTKYERTHRVDLPPANSGWQIRVVRTTPNSTSGTIADTTSVDAVTEVIDAKLRYPGSAIMGVQFDSSQFQSIPTRSFDLYGRIIRVPSNYDAETRAYIGVWDGSFKSAWTDNPAWIFYDLLLHFRYGLGHLLNAGQVDKWELYRIGQYCDQMVPNGKGGTEPRFTCNLFLSVRAEALQVLQDLATTFRGMAYWAAGSVTAVADIPEDPVYTYSNANVIDGKFGYFGSAKKTRYTVALVSWNDPTDFYRQKVEYVDDQPGIARYGIQQTEMTATGCTSQAQAQRVGKWALLTNRLETESVGFSVGLDGTLARPGQIIRIADNDRAGRRIGGRLRSSTLDTLILDADVTAYPGDTITLIMPNGKAVSRVIKSAGYPLTWDSNGITWDNGNITLDTTGLPAEVQQVVLTEELDDLPPKHSMWAIDSPTLAVQQFRVMSVVEDASDTEIKFTVSAVRHNSSKYGAIDNGSRLERPPVTVIPPSVQPPPINVTVSNDHFVDQGSAISVMTIAWEKPTAAIAYEVYWRKNDGDWVFAGRTGTTSVDVSGIYAGRYVAKVRAINSLDIGSVFATSAETVLTGKTTPPPTVSAFTAESIVFGIKLKWEIPDDLSTADLQRTEIWYSETNQIAEAIKFGDYANPQTDLTIMGLTAGKRFFFWARLVDRTGNVGPFYPVVNGVMGQASSDAGPILNMLAGKIGKTELGQDLLSDINKIPGLQDQIDALDDILLYDAAKTYVAGDTVRQGQRLYQAIASVPVNNPPPNAIYWLDVGQTVGSVGALAQQVALNKTSIETVDGKVTAQGSTLNALRAATRDDSGNGDKIDALKGWASTAAIATEQKVRSSNEEAAATRTTTIDAKVNQNAANVTLLESTVASNKEASAQQVAQVNAEVANNKAAIQQTTSALADTNGKLSTLWSVKMETTAGGQKYAASFGLGLQVDPSGVSSQFVVRADTFMLLNLNNGTPVSPFSVSGGQTFVASAFIQDGTITNAKIGEYISSTNYIAGQQGWILKKDGTFEINGIAPGQGRSIMTNRSLRFWDNNNVKRIQLGDQTE